MVRALIEIYRQEGFMPDCRMSLDKGFSQGVRFPFSVYLHSFVANSIMKGSNADNVLSDSYLKDITAGVNWEDGLAAMIKDATVTPPDWSVEGRGGIERG